MVQSLCQMHIPLAGADARRLTLPELRDALAAAASVMRGQGIDQSTAIIMGSSSAISLEWFCPPKVQAEDEYV